MFRRSDFRLVCYRKRKNAAIPEGMDWILEEIEKVRLPEDSWESFSTSWDIFVSKNAVSRIIPEIDEVYVNNTCIEIKTKLSMGAELKDVEASLSTRQKNIYDVVVLNYLGSEVDWANYNETWGVKIDYASKRIEVYSKNTKINKVTFEQPKVVEEKESSFTTTKGNVEDLDPAIFDKIKAFLLKEKE